MLLGTGPRSILLGGFGIQVLVASRESQPAFARPLHYRPNGLESPYLRLEAADETAVKFYNETKGPQYSGLLQLVGLPQIDEWLEQDAEYIAKQKADASADPFGSSGQPHFEIGFVPMFSNAFQCRLTCLPERDYFTEIVDLLRLPFKRGVITLKPADPLQDRTVNLNFLEHELGIIALRQGLRFVDYILMNGQEMKDIIDKDYPFPAPRNPHEGLKL